MPNSETGEEERSIPCRIMACFRHKVDKCAGSTPQGYPANSETGDRERATGPPIRPITDINVDNPACFPPSSVVNPEHTVDHTLGPGPPVSLITVINLSSQHVRTVGLSAQQTPLSLRTVGLSAQQASLLLRTVASLRNTSGWATCLPCTSGWCMPGYVREVYT